MTLDGKLMIAGAAAMGISFLMYISPERMNQEQVYSQGSCSSAETESEFEAGLRREYMPFVSKIIKLDILTPTEKQVDDITKALTLYSTATNQWGSIRDKSGCLTRQEYTFIHDQYHEANLLLDRL